MFTGIVTASGKIAAVGGEGGDRVLRIETDWDCLSIPIGASISHAGICLTVTARDATGYEVAASAETMSVTTLGSWQQGDTVNLERALAVGDELGGHIVSGHVDGLAEVLSVEAVGDSHVVWFRAPKGLARFVAAKGSVALDGVSLTVNAVDGTDFSVNVIQHTWDVTTLGRLQAGSKLNMEIDMLARYVARLNESSEHEV
ncbi:MAG: riboflavin synthase [SAR116 cluster bacterium MED-G05]|jgi:riboflavin synthase|nr:MAG: riboflavin synthase [SAR116 cluster bacterium MED-G05]HCA90343.1 riboflavin synthase [Alphaproteobacteria bacterium]HCD78466.1 riboflavin synthase [Alphaproteobacteria bacterium]|tara:strand:- start:3220 stop:3822 length:603 start_codon:yes stop_codon:yes gene_type:complete